MKKIFAIIFAALIVTAMVSCGSDNKDNKSDKSDVGVEEAPVTEVRAMETDEFVKILGVSMSPQTHDVSAEEAMTSHVSFFDSPVEFHFFEFIDDTAAADYYEELKGSLAAKELFSKAESEYLICKYEDETYYHMISKVDSTILYGIGMKAKNANLEEWFVGFEYLVEDDAKAILDSQAE